MPCLFRSFIEQFLNSYIFYLELSNNSVSGQIPSSLFTSPFLMTLDLSHNQFDLLDEVRNASSSSLLEVDLNNNKLQGQIPKSIFENMGLIDLVLHSNSFSGTVNLAMFKILRDSRTSIF